MENTLLEIPNPKKSVWLCPCLSMMSLDVTDNRCSEETNCYAILGISKAFCHYASVVVSTVVQVVDSKATFILSSQNYVHNSYLLLLY